MNHVALVDPVSVPELLPVFAALRRGTRRSRLRSLEVVCRQHDRRLLEVFGKGENAVILVHWRRAAEVDGFGAVRLVDLLTNDLPVRAQNQCCTKPVFAGTITAALDRGSRRLAF